ncbi:hypothetical protein BKA81DRAFT_89813 [Phyllosticta paracitricarpa]
MRWEYPTSCSVCHCLETGATWTCARSGTESAKEIRRLAHHARPGCRAAADFSPRTNQTSDRRYDFSLMSKERSLFACARADWVQRSCQASHGKCWSSQRQLEYRGPTTYVWPCVTVFPCRQVLAVGLEMRKAQETSADRGLAGDGRWPFTGRGRPGPRKLVFHKGQCSSPQLLIRVEDDGAVRRPLRGRENA